MAGEFILWAKRSLAKELQVVNVPKFFENGKAFCALIYKYFPEEIDYPNLVFTQENTESNLQLAINIAAKFGVTPTLTPKDIMSMTNKAQVTQYLLHLRQGLLSHTKQTEPSPSKEQHDVGMSFGERKERYHKKTTQEPSVTKVVDSETPTKLVRTGSVKQQVIQTKRSRDLPRTRSALEQNTATTSTQNNVVEIINKHKMRHKSLQRAKSEFSDLLTEVPENLSSSNPSSPISGPNTFINFKSFSADPKPPSQKFLQPLPQRELSFKSSESDSEEGEADESDLNLDMSNGTHAPIPTLTEKWKNSQIGTHPPHPEEPEKPIVTESPLDAHPEVHPKAPPEAPLEVQPEAQSEVQPEVPREAPPEAPLEVQTEAQLEVLSEVQPEVEVEVEPVVVQPEVLLDAKLETQQEAQKEVQLQVKAQPEVQLDTQMEIQLVPQLEGQSKVPPPETQQQAQSEVQLQVKAQPEVQLQVKAQPEVQLQVKAQPEVQLQVKAQPGAQAHVKAQPEVQAKVETQPKTQLEATETSELEVPLESKPNDKPKTHPQYNNNKQTPKFEFKLALPTPIPNSVLLTNQFLNQLEKSTLESSQQLNNIITSLQEGLHSVSSTSTQFMGVYKLATENLTEQVNHSAVAMHSLITKAQQLNADFNRVETVYQEIKAIRQTVDAFSLVVNDIIKQ